MFSLAGRLARGPRVAVLIGWVVILAALVAYAALTALGVDQGGVLAPLLPRLYTFVVTAPAIAIFVRVALVREDRLAWSLIGAAALAWAAGDAYWAFALADDDEAPFPSLADAGYLAYFPLAYAGLVVLVRARVRRFHASQWLDGVAAALAVGAIGAAVLLPPIIAGNEGASAAAVTTNLAYPLGDLLILGLLAALTGLMGWRPGRAVGLLLAGSLVFALADAIYLFEVASGTYVEGGLLDVLWPLATVAIGLAAWQPARRTAAARLEGWSVMVLPGSVAFAAITLLVYDHYVPASAGAVWLAAAALVVCVLRGGLTFRENITQAVTDGLTGLPNRLLFHDRLETAVQRARRNAERVAVMVIDLDRFKDVNDTLGHHSGDLLLQEVGRRLRATLRESDTVARLGGDEFAVLLPSVADAAAAEKVARALSAALGASILVDGLSLDPEASIGIALFPEHGLHADDLLQRADVAMYRAKSESRDHAVYGAEADDNSPERLALIGGLRRAIEQDELVLHYQPKVDLLTGAVSGVEALVRWAHPERGLLAPGEFIPAAEQTAVIRPLTLHVIQRAARQCRQWEDEGHLLTVAVNISARNLLDPGFPHDVAAILAAERLGAGRLELEITETALMANRTRAIGVLRELGEMGIVLAIDDFGVGYSSLSYLRRLPVHVLKVDRSFVQNMSREPADATIVRSTVALGRSLGLTVVAEGIENQEAQDELRAIGCEVGQGFHIARPMPADQVVPWLAASAEASRPAPTVVAR